MALLLLWASFFQIYAAAIRDVGVEETWRPEEQLSSIQLTVILGQGQESYTFILLPEQTVSLLKDKLEDETDIPVGHQTLTCDTGWLADEATLGSYGFMGEVTLYLVSSSRARSVLFSSMKEEAKRDVTFSTSAPEWRRIVRGLNVEGICKNLKCRAYTHRAWSMRGMDSGRKMVGGAFEMNREVKKSPCPLCKAFLDEVGCCGFYKCRYEFEGVLEGDDFQEQAGEGIADANNGFVKFG